MDIFPVCVFLLILLLNNVIVVLMHFVNVNQGILKGTDFITAGGRKIIAFLGVPYALPPTEQNRFKEPQPLENWIGIRDATKASARCLQLKYFDNRTTPVVGEEDCLYLNIYTPSLTKNTTLLPVIVFIHGGAFMNGAGSDYTPKYLLNNHDFIFVTLNYRLGPLGFLSTEDDIVPGNNGLKDQVSAFKWLKQNVKFFNGNPNRITLTGMSAGGASVHLHYMSPMTKDIFQQGISISGTALCPWVLAEAPKLKARLLASSVNCPSDSSHHMIECMRTRSGHLLIEQIKSLFMPWLYVPFSPFGPTVEVSTRETFLSDYPQNLMKERNIHDLPWITSVTMEEGLYPAAAFVDNSDLLEDLNLRWKEIAPHLLDYYYIFPKNKIDEVSEKIRYFYLKQNPISVQSRKQLINMISDRLFIIDAENAAKLQAAAVKSPVYFYRFAQKSLCTLSKKLCQCESELGVCHGDDLTFVMGCFFGGPEVIPYKDKMMWRMINMWTSFAQTGHPTIGSDLKLNWTVVNPNSKLNYLFLKSSENIVMKSLDSETLPFWNYLMKNETPLNPCVMTHGEF